MGISDSGERATLRKFVVAITCVCKKTSGSWAGRYPENMTHTGALFSETYSARR